VKITLAELAGLVEGELIGPPDREISGIKGLDQAGSQDLSFLANPKYAHLLEDCKAGAVLVTPEQKVGEDLAVIRVKDPYLAFAKCLTYAVKTPHEPLGVHSRAVVEKTAQLGRDVSIHAGAYVGADASLGDRVVLHPGVYVGPGATICDDTVLHPNVVVYKGCQVGKRCIIHAGTVIGADGYGFAPDGEGYFKIPQIGIVQIDDDVELGALNTIDRAAMGRTWIQKGVKTDNMVHVAHNCVIGENTLLVAQVGISGSTKLGRHVVAGGQVGVAGHLTIGDNVVLGAKTGVTNSIGAKEVVAGYPHLPHRLWLRTRALIRRLPDLFERVKKLETRLEENAGKKEE
jgi:UDP-3-O-[3-hydroxymyristoyl] glucosamine N-acyltransferase